MVDRAISEQATGESSAEIPAFAGMTAWARDEGSGVGGGTAASDRAGDPGEAAVDLGS